jgi:hypothetical protein
MIGILLVCVVFTAPAQEIRDEAEELLRRHRQTFADLQAKKQEPSSPLQAVKDGTASVADSGTNGDVIMSSPAPFTSTGVLLQAKSSWPYVVAKTGTSDSGSGFAVFNSSNVEQLRVRSDGYVGIGTTVPGAKLHVQGEGLNLGNYPPAGATESVTLFTMFNRAASGGDYSWRFATASSGGGFGIVPNAFELYEYPSNASLACCYRRFIARPANVASPKVFVIDGAGNVGIGAWTPAAALHVAGNAQFDGTVTGTNIRAQYQDVAEWVPSDEDLAPGTVVVLDANIGNGVMASHRSYDTTVAGVVSAQPGIILGEQGASKEQVATTGRVRVKVDASRGAIAVGDLLVTSDKPGFAMRSTPIDVGGTSLHRPGTIVGKALEPLGSGEGEILVLLSLQ